MANMLGMSYITSDLFEVAAVEDKGLSQPDPAKPGSQASRTLKLNNTFEGEGDEPYCVRSRENCDVFEQLLILFQWWDKTNLEFYDWTVEVQWQSSPIQDQDTR